MNGAENYSNVELFDVVETVEDKMKKWKKYLLTLEEIRVMGICNMYLASEPLVDAYEGDLEEEEADKILIFFMNNYEEIQETYTEEFENILMNTETL